MQITLKLCTGHCLVVVSIGQLWNVEVGHVLSFDIHLLHLSIIDSGAV